MKSPSAIHQRLKEMHWAGSTQRELATKAKIVPGHMNRLMHNPDAIARCSLETILNLFPDLDPVIAEACSGDSINASGNGNKVINRSPGASISEAEAGVKLRILEALTRLDIPADILLTVMRTVRDVK